MIDLVSSSDFGEGKIDDGLDNTEGFQIDADLSDNEEDEDAHLRINVYVYDN